MKKLLIVGDSFCSPNQETYSWHNQLNSYYSITNLGQNGVGQYKIHQQLMSVPVEQYDGVLMLATSPYRIHVESNPFYDSKHQSHYNADLLYADILHKEPGHNKDHVIWWFEKIFDLEQARFQQLATINWDIQYLKKYNKPYCVINFFDKIISTDFPVESLNQIWRKYPGTINHLSAQGHNVVFQQLITLLSKIHSAAA